MKVVKKIYTDLDRSRSDIIESLLSIFKSAVDLDFMFLFGKGLDAFRNFINVMHILFTESFSMQTKLNVAMILQSFLS